MPLPAPNMHGHFADPESSAREYREALRLALARGPEDAHTAWLRDRAQQAERQYRREAAPWWKRWLIH